MFNLCYSFFLLSLSRLLFTRIPMEYRKQGMPSVLILWALSHKLDNIKFWYYVPSCW